MLFIDIRVPVGKIFWGNVLLIVCSLFYLAWWCAAFKPRADAGIVKTSVLFGFTAAAGIGGLVLVVKGVLASSGAGGSKAGLSNTAILLGGIGAYVLLLIATSVFLKRQVTSELLIIIGWTVLELCVINVMAGAGCLSTRVAFISGGAAIVAAIISLVCYLQYYRLEPYAGYVCGMVPLILAALVMLGITASLVLSSIF